MIIVNTLLEPVKVEKDQIKRVLHIDEDLDLVVTINIMKKTSLPIKERLSNLKSLVDNGTLQLVKNDPLAYLLDDTNRSVEHLKRRDRAWDIIKPLVLNGDRTSNTRIYDSKWRGPKLRELQDQGIAAKSTTMDWLRKFWQRGQVQNALLPALINCGGKGKEHVQNDKKLGRPAWIKPAEGIPLTPEIKKLFNDGIQEYYKEGAALTHVFDQISAIHFNSGFEKKDNKLIPILLPTNKRPTFRQFQNHFQINWEKNREENQRRYYGWIDFENNWRARTGSSSRMAIGPGYIVQMDSTVADIYLVSSLDRSRLIGRPILYMLVDVWSHLIVGFSLTLEGPSWDAARQALYNMFEDKVAYCKNFGITISDYEWPWHYAPFYMIGDRGESLSENADTLAKNFRIELSNTARFMAIWKPIIESQFKLINIRGVNYLPGHVYKKRRGDRDYRLDATLTLNEMREIIITLIRHHNTHHVVRNPWSDEGLIQQHIEPHPIDLWHWGIRNKTGRLREVNLDLAKIYLLPRAEATVTENGIFFNQCLYESEYARKNGWLSKAAEKGTYRVETLYEPRDSNYIFLQVDYGEYSPCYISKNNSVFDHRDWYDILTHNYDQTVMTATWEHNSQQGRVEMNAHIRDITKNAEKLAKAAKVGKTKSEQTGNVRENKKDEIEIDHQDDVPLVEVAEDSLPSPVAPNGYIPDNQYVEDLDQFEKEYQDEKQQGK